MKSKLHFLFIRFSSLGDIVLNSSLFPALKKVYGEKIKITFLTSNEFSPLYSSEEYPFIDEVVSFSRRNPIMELYKDIEDLNAREPIDLMIDLHGTLRSILLRFKFWKIPRIYVDKRTFERSLLTWLKIDTLSGQFNRHDQRPKRFGELLLKRNFRDFQKILDLPDLNEVFTNKENRISSCKLSFTESVPEGLFDKFGINGNYIVMVPSASFPEKRWEVEKFYDLLESCLGDSEFRDFQFIIVAGPDDSFCSVFDSLNEKFHHRFINLQGKTSIEETLHISKNAKFVVGNDTGVPHFTESVGTPCIFILGPTGEQFGFYPHLASSEIIKLNLWCRPCTTNGKGRCIRSERFCLTKISVSMVKEKMLRLKKNLV